MISFKNSNDRKQRSYEFLWISEKFYLQGICMFVKMAKVNPQRNLNELSQPLNCIFNDVLRLDFKKFKLTLVEFQSTKKAREAEKN